MNIAVTAGNTNDPRLQLTPSSLTLPLSPYSIGQQVTSPFPGNFLGSPYIGEVALQFRHSNGQFVSGTTAVNVSITPNSTAGFSTLDDPTTDWTGLTKTPPTTDGNEFLTIEGNGFVNVTGGEGTLFIHAGNVPGTATLTVTATDPDNSQTISSQLIITVAGSGTTLPSSISASSPNGVYISGSNGPQSGVVTATVTDGSGALVADPSTGQGGGFDNVQFQIVGPSGSDARLSAVNAAGQTQTGSTVVVPTHQGVATVTLQSGSQQGPVQIRATTDRGDGNVDNGLQDPVSATTSVVISDGKLFSLTLTSPGVLSPSILINRVSSEATLIDQNTGTTPTIPPDPNATYSFTVSAIGTDRQGNPILPGTSIKFGSIDSPSNVNGQFLISGVQGDPHEGDTIFDALDGQFKTAGGGAGPGDTLLVFGKLVQGNDDLESAAKVTSVVSQTRLTVATPFNLNDTTGKSVDDGPVLPYIVGRAEIGNISSPATTDAVGAVSTTLNYPVSALGHAAAIWAQGTSTDTVTGGTKLVTDIAVVVFPGIAPANIVISPSPIPGNLTIPVQACIYDALGSPLAGVDFNFSFDNMGVGSGTLDNIPTAGVVPDVTDSSGCVETSVVTTGIAGSSGTGTTTSPQLTFTAGGTTKSAPITASGGLILLATPSALGGTGGSVTLQLLNSNGTPVPNVQLTGTCTGDASIGLSFPGTTHGVTDINGKTNASITANLNGVTAGSGSCTFTTSTGTPTAKVTLQGESICNGTSPLPPECSGTGTGASTAAIDITVQDNDNLNAANMIVSSPAGFSCNLNPALTTQSCLGALPVGTYTFTVTGGGVVSGIWSNACTSDGKLTVTSAGTTYHCSVTVAKPP